MVKIHIVEDTIVFGRIIEKALSQDDGYDVTLFTTGEDFLKNLHLNPDIVSIDYNLPLPKLANA
jgi:DNA-binding response OmpR family regulator